MRDDKWLEDKLIVIWKLFFTEIEEKNKVKIRFKGKWKNKFGHIGRKKEESEICVNGLFRHLEVPEWVIELTIAHELVHYMHGFHSDHVKMFRYPHQGGVVRKELIKRGFSVGREKKWYKEEWLEMYERLRYL